MGLFSNGFKVGTGLAIGIGALILLPIAAPVLAAAAKPLVRAGLKRGMILFHKGREAIAEASEALEDLAVEARTELAKEQEAVVNEPVPGPKKDSL
jgi:hypothetical protein